MVFAGKHRSNVMKKFQEQGKKGRDLISATGKELGKMYRAQKKTSPKPVNKSRKPKKTSRKPKKASRKPKKASRKPKKASRKPKKVRKYKAHDDLDININTDLSPYTSMKDSYIGYILSTGVGRDWLYKKVPEDVVRKIKEEWARLPSGLYWNKTSYFQQGVDRERKKLGYGKQYPTKWEKFNLI